MIEILTLRHNLWTHVASRKHSPTKVFFGGPRELMLYGTARFVLRADADKQEVEVPWAGRVVFGEGEELKMRFYQVYLVSIPPSTPSFGVCVCHAWCGADEGRILRCSLGRSKIGRKGSKGDCIQ